MAPNYKITYHLEGRAGNRAMAAVCSCGWRYVRTPGGIQIYEAGAQHIAEAHEHVQPHSKSTEERIAAARGFITDALSRIEGIDAISAQVLRMALEELS